MAAQAATSRKATHKVRVPEPGPDAGSWLFFIFMAALVVMVGAIALLAAVDAWWILVAVVGLDLILTFIVLATIVWVLGDLQVPS